MAIIKKKIEDLKPGKNYLITVRAKNSDLNAFSEAADSIKISIPKDPTIPEYPNNLQLYASFEQVMFVFDPAPDIDISYYEYELYEASQITGSYPNYTISGSPVVSGQSASNVFTVSVQNSSKNDAGAITSVSYKGRVKSVDTSLNKSFWSPIVTTNQSTPLIDSQYINSLTASKITAGTIGSAEIIMSGANSIIKSSTFNGTAVGDGSYTGATQGWLINGTGKSYFYDATIVGSIDIGGFDSGSFHVDTSGNLWLGASSYASAPFRISNDGNVDVGGADSTSFHIDNSGNIWAGAGAFNTSTNPFSVTSAGILRATNAIISGNITATSGTFTGTVTGSTISGSTITGNNIATGDIFIRESTGGRFYLTYLLGDYLQTKRMTDSTYSAITGSGAFLGYFNASTVADDAAMIVNSTTPYTSGTYVSAQSNGNIVATGTIYPGNIEIYSGAASFGSSVRQMINLWSTSYGIGIQNNTQYYRSGKNFAWYTGGSHADGELDSGSGTRRMYLTNSDLVVLGNSSAANGNVYTGYWSPDANWTGAIGTNGYVLLSHPTAANGIYFRSSSGPVHIGGTGSNTLVIGNGVVYIGTNTNKSGIFCALNDDMWFTDPQNGRIDIRNYADTDWGTSQGYYLYPSSIKYKKDIVSASTVRLYQDMISTKVYEFNYIEDTNDHIRAIGPILEKSPMYFKRKHDDSGIIASAYTAMLHGAMQEMAKKISELELRIGELSA